MEKQTDEKAVDAFDLPEPLPGPKATPRIHKGPADSTCVSCEG